MCAQHGVWCPPATFVLPIFLLLSQPGSQREIPVPNEATSLCSVAPSGPTLCNPMDCSPPGSSVHGDSPGKKTGVGCHALLQGIFLTQGSNPSLLRLLHWRADSSPLALKPSSLLPEPQEKVETSLCNIQDPSGSCSCSISHHSSACSP